MNGTDSGSAEHPWQGSDEAPLLDGWTANRLLAQGAHAEAWIVESASTRGETRVLKLPKTVSDAVALEREQRFAGSLDHPHIVEYCGVVATSRGEATLWEHCAAGDALSLVHILGPLTVGQTVTVLVPVAQALDYAHSRGVIHGDVSPGNIVFDTNGKPKLCDMGEARSVDRPDRWTGTEGFFAPELDVEARSLSLQPAADVYSLAALGWFLLTGRIPGAEAQRPALNLLRSDVDEDVAELLEAALQETPALRPTLTEFSVACYAWATPEPLQLHALVDEQTALFLPTRHESSAVRREAGRSHRRRPRVRRVAQGRQKRAKNERPRLLNRNRNSSMRSAHRRMATGVVTAALGTTLILAHSWASTGTSTERSAEARAETDARAPEWSRIVSEWSEHRAEALTERETSAVDRYAVATSQVAVDDQALIASLHDQGIVYEGLTMSARVNDVTVNGATAHLDVDWTMSSYTARIVDDEVHGEEAATGHTEQVWIESTLVGDEWRISSVVPQSSGASTAQAGPAVNHGDALE